MAFTQQTFLGASIRGWTSSIGYGGGSSITIQLVEDATNGDIFSPVDPGVPVYFQYGNFTFGGLLQRVRATGGQSGSPLYEVTIIDPSSILEGVQLILSNYNGSVSVPNVFNVFGYLESIGGFGGADVNSAGIPYAKIIKGLLGISNSGSSTYGRYISFRGYQYRFDLSNLPPVPQNYRFTGDSISLMDFIREVCTLGGAEDSYFFKLEQNVIRLYAMTRNSNPVTGAITRFIIDTPGAISKDIGLELRNQTTSKLLVGGDVEKIHLQVFDDETVQPFWGVDKDNNAIIGFNNDDVYQFTADARRINIPGMTPTYTMDIPELRSALDSRESWEIFLLNNNDVDGIHKGKADRLGIQGNLGQVKAFLDDLIGEDTDLTSIKAKLKNVTPLEFTNLTRNALEKNNPLTDSDADYIDEYIQTLYEFVSSYANSYYGKKFMVKIPYLYTYTESETGNVVTSQEPSDSGYVEEEYVERAVQLNILPEDSDALTNAENKIICYVRFDNAQDLDLSEISPEDLVFNRTTVGRGNKRNSEGLSVFIKCQVQSTVVYQNYSTKFSPRVVVELPGAVRSLSGDERNRYNGIFADILKKTLAARNLEDAFEEIAREYTAKFGADVLFYGTRGEALNPTMLGVPLKSKVESYGPWFASGGDGKTEYQKDSNLVPWNYGGFELMNLAGNAAVASAISSQFVSEAGSVEFPDVPAISLGDLLVSSGPYVTDIDTSIGRDGAKTTYRMQNWTPRFGKVPQSIIDRMQRIALSQIKLKKEMLARSRVSPILTERTQRVVRDTVNRRSHNSSHGVICGEITKTDERSIVSIFMQPTYNSIPQIAANYSDKAIASLDSLFIPFSTDVAHTGNLPHYETRTSFTEDFEYLDPFRGTHMSTIMSKGEVVPQDLVLRKDGYPSDNNYRALALRAPLILAGYGYTTSGTQTHQGQDYRIKPQDWKVGPLDAKWDGNRHVWVAGGTSSKLIRAISNGDGTAQIAGVYDGVAASGSTVNLLEWLNGPTCSGQRVYLTKEDENIYSVVNIQYSALEVVTDVTCNDDVITKCTRTIYLPSAYSTQACEGIS